MCGLSIRQGTQEHHQVRVSEGCQMFDFHQEFFSNLIVWHHFRLLVMGCGWMWHVVAMQWLNMVECCRLMMAYVRGKSWIKSWICYSLKESYQRDLINFESALKVR